MGKLGVVCLILLLAYCCVSCSETESDLVKAGDQIDGMLITAGWSWLNWDISIDHYCDMENQLEVTEGVYEAECWAKPGEAVFLNNQGMAGDSFEELDEYWEDVSIELFINGRKLDLPSFGPIDSTDHEGGYFRLWNVAIDELAPGEHTIRSIVDYPPEHWESTLNFTVSEEPP